METETDDKIVPSLQTRTRAEDIENLEVEFEGLLRQQMNRDKGEDGKGDEEEEPKGPQNGASGDPDGDPLDWVSRTSGQEIALVAFAVPEPFDVNKDDWAFRVLGLYPSQKEANDAMEELYDTDDRFIFRTCQMYDGLAWWPPTRNELVEGGLRRFRNKEYQQFHDEAEERNKSNRKLMRQQARDYQDNPDDPTRGGLYPLPSTTITPDGVHQRLVTADEVLEKDVGGVARSLALERGSE